MTDIQVGVAPVTVIGIGNPYRRDDGAAGAVLAQLARQWAADPRVRLVELDGESVRLVQAWEGSHTVWIVDAVRSGRAAGSIHEVDAQHLGELDDTGKRLGGGHLMGLAEAVDLARVLDRLPPQLRILGIEGIDFDNGEGLSPQVSHGIAAAAAHLSAAIAEALGT
ncbi:MAG: hydrogenase maturation protease [Actinomycetota bacterium]